MHSPFLCPHDGDQLVRAKLPAELVRKPRGIHWGCRQCKGRWVSVALLRRLIGRGMVKKLWAQAREAPAAGRSCPECRRPLRAAHPAPDVPEIDVCRRCHFVWFDPDEFSSLREIAPPETVDADRRREALRAFEQQRRRRQDRYESTSDTFPDEWWKVVPMVLGFPVESGPVVSGRPYVTWVLGLLMIAVFAWTSTQNVAEVYSRYALIPQDWFRGFGLTWVTSFFLHGGGFHLAANLWFLLLYGDNVEEELGSVRTLLLIIVATFLGDVCHIALEPESAVPTIGASGGISGLILYYGLRFPHVKIHMAIKYILWFSVTARTALYMWLFVQVIGVLAQVGGMSDVSSLAHLGGALAGIGAFWWWRDGR